VSGENPHLGGFVEGSVPAESINGAVGANYVPPNLDLKPGDWICSGCGNNNFARRFECNRCKLPRSEREVVVGKGGKGSIMPAPMYGGGGKGYGGYGGGGGDAMYGGKGDMYGKGGSMNYGYGGKGDGGYGRGTGYGYGDMVGQVYNWDYYQQQPPPHQPQGYNSAMPYSVGGNAWGGGAGGYGKGGKGPVVIGAGGGNIDRKPGDWDCQQCGNNNFARRTECNRCGASNSSAQTSSGGSEYQLPPPPPTTPAATTHDNKKREMIEDGVDKKRDAKGNGEDNRNVDDDDDDGDRASSKRSKTNKTEDESSS
jgi:hypothetical protein